MRSAEEALAPCVHCGFCLPACPTYLATLDENDSPRGRIVLMRAFARGELPAHDPDLNRHLDACLGCRGCEPACPSGVAYGEALEASRASLAQANGLSWPIRAALAVFRREPIWRPAFAVARMLRASGAPAGRAGGGRVGFALGMLAATAPAHRPAGRGGLAQPTAGVGPAVVLFRGCVMDGLFRHVHDATRRTLAANGCRVVEVRGSVCCGALHAHAGDLRGARELARRNLAALAGKADYVVVNSAGCGAQLKAYGELLGETGGVRLAASVRDVSEVLAERGPRAGAPLPDDVVYDPPCHLQHAQGVHDAPLALLGAIPELRVRVLPGGDQCCGSAGIYSLVRPGMARAVLAPKIQALAQARPRPRWVATGNPGCLMQIGAGLRAAGLDIRAVHPVELLDWSYRAAPAHASA